MTAPETVHLYALIALRALADHDPFEFKRSTDLSKRQLDEHIERLVTELRYSEADERRLGDITEKLDDLRGLEMMSESPATLSYLFRQVGNSSLERAYQLALTMDSTGELRQDPTRRASERKGKSTVPRVSQSEPEFLRLGVMRLLRDLPGYEPRFGYRFRNMEIDCFLEPTTEGYPPILIEAKASVPSRAVLDTAARQLTKVSAGWGSGVITALLTTSIPEDIRVVGRRERSKFFLLEFDPEANEFDSRDHEALVSAVTSRGLL